jgi:hypothetical protein
VEVSEPTVTPSAPAPAAEPSAPVVDKTLQQFRAEKAAPAAPVVESPVVVAAPAPAHPLAVAEPPEPADEPETLEPPDPAAVKAPEKGADHRWKDPETGIVLDMRRRDHRRMKRALEERHAFAQRLMQPPVAPAQTPAAPEPREATPRALSVDPADPEPQLEQFADQPDPYAAHMRAVARWEARQEHKALSAQRATVERTQRVTAAIESAQASFDADLPAVRERYTDFDAAYGEVIETLARVPLARRTPIVHRLLTAPQRHDLAYFLGNHPQELQRLVSARSPQEQQFVMGEIASQVKSALAAPVAPLKPAAPPMAPVNAGSTPTTYDPATANLAQFRAKHGVRGGRRLAS